MGRREMLAVALSLAVPPEALALPRGGIDARVAAAFNTAFAAGGDPVVCAPFLSRAISLSCLKPLHQDVEYLVRDSL